MVAPGENAILECFADGNPSPEIQWIFHPAANVVNATGWRHSVLTVSEATSTNVGVYMCVATNKVGRVTRFDTLLMKGTVHTHTHTRTNIKYNNNIVAGFLKRGIYRLCFYFVSCLCYRSKHHIARTGALGLVDSAGSSLDYRSHCVFDDLQEHEKTSTVLLCPEQFQE